MENKQEKQVLNTISFQLESKCKRGLESCITFVPKFNVNEKDEIGNETKYKGQVKVSLQDIKITDTYFQCVDNTLYNVPVQVVKGINLASWKAYFNGKTINGVKCTISGYKGIIVNTHKELNENNEEIDLFDIMLDRQLHYIIQD